MNCKIFSLEKSLFKNETSFLKCAFNKKYDYKMGCQTQSQLTNLHLFGMRLPLFFHTNFFYSFSLLPFWHFDTCFTFLFLFNPSINLADTFHFQYLSFFLNLSPFSISQVLNPLASSTRAKIPLSAHLAQPISLIFNFQV